MAADFQCLEPTVPGGAFYDFRATGEKCTWNLNISTVCKLSRINLKRSSTVRNKEVKGIYFTGFYLTIHTEKEENVSL